MSVEDFVLNPRLSHGRRIAESLESGAVIEIDMRFYDRTPLIYRGRQVWAHVDAARSGIGVQSLYDAVKHRELVQANQSPGAPVYVDKEDAR